MKIILIALMFIGLWGYPVRIAYAEPERIVRISQTLTDPPTLDAHMHHNIETEDIIRQVCDHLVDRDPNGRLIPALATSWQLINETTWQFNLRKGVMFHNGEKFDSKAVKFSIDRIIDPNGKSPQKQMYESIDHVEIVSDYKINIITKKTDVLLPSKLSVLGNILPMGNLKEVGDNEFGKHPIGTGPFKFLEWTKGKEVVFITNKDYWGGAPKIDKVIFKFIPNLDKQVEMLINGELDIVSNISARSALELKKNPRTDVVKKPTMQYISSQLNTLKNGPLADIRVRRALNCAVDVDKLIRYVVNGNGRKLATITMPEEFGFNSALKINSCDIQMARNLLMQAGYPNGFNVDLVAFDELEQLAKAMQKQLSIIGVKVTIKLISRKEFIEKILQNNLDFEITLGNPTDPYCDASYQLNLMFNSKSPFSRYHNREVDDLLNESFKTMNENRRRMVLEKIQEIIYLESPKIFLFQVIKLYGMNKNVSKFVAYSDGLLRLNEISLSK